jgi:acetate---CoA ligase (ADP-forming)
VSNSTQAAIARMLRPRSIAIVGASPTPGSLGGSVFANLERFGYAGEIHLINPNRAEINGRPCLKSTADLPDGVDCAVLAIPRPGVLEAMKGCAARKVGGVVIFSAGFAEAGADGRAQQDELARIARASGMAVEGPNCLGFVNCVDGVPLTFGTVDKPAPIAGRRAIGIVSQSGAMATVIRAALNAHDVPFSFTVSSGNEAVNGLEDFLEFLIEDASTHVIVMVVEQFRTPKRFLALTRRARELGKPIVLQHPGRSAAAKASAATHTGAMSGDYEIMRTLVNSAGALVVDTLEELIDLGELLIRWPVLPKAGTAVLTESGAHKGMMLDFCESIGLVLPEPSPASQKIIGAIAPDLILPTNPLDLTAQALVDPDLYRKTLEPLFADERYGSVVLTIILSSVAHNPRKMRYVINALDELKPQKPVLFAMLGEDVAVPPEIIGELRARNVPFFRSPERAVRALARVTEFAARRPAAPIAATPAASKKIPAGTLPEFQSKLILATEAEIPIPAGAVVTELGSAKTVARQIGYPVALKAQAAALAHKSEAGGVVLNLRDEAALSAGWDKLHANVAKARPGLTLDGVLVEAMARPGVELILGARNDKDWGPVLLIGLGGVFAEALHDVRVLPPDLDAAAIAHELHQLKGAALLKAFRGAPARDVRAAAAMAARLAAFVRAHPEVAEVDVNPVLVYGEGEGAVALDALIVVR